MLLEGQIGGHYASLKTAHLSAGLGQVRLGFVHLFSSLLTLKILDLSDWSLILFFPQAQTGIFFLNIRKNILGAEKIVQRAECMLFI